MFYISLSLHTSLTYSYMQSIHGQINTRKLFPNTWIYSILTKLAIRIWIIWQTIQNRMQKKQWFWRDVLLDVQASYYGHTFYDILSFYWETRAWKDSVNSSYGEIMNIPRSLIWNTRTYCIFISHDQIYS